jgi:Periplasmic protein TonB, links inner and outer membranes
MKAINGGVLNGKAVSLPKPEFPDSAKAAGVEGIVKVQVTIDENGNVESAQAVKDESDSAELSTEKADAKAAFRESAERAALEAKFSPTLLSGNPVKVKGIIVYNFVTGKVIDGGVINSKAIELPAPTYPAAAKAVSASGTVVVQVTIDEVGNVISAAAASGHPLLQAAAVDAARRAKFLPTQLSGKPVKISGTLIYKFDLTEKSQQ